MIEPSNTEERNKQGSKTDLDFLYGYQNKLRNFWNFGSLKIETHNKVFH